MKSATSSLVLAGAATMLAAWSAALAIGGGIVLNTPMGRLSSRDPVRPLLASVVLFAAYGLSTRRKLSPPLLQSNRRALSALAFGFILLALTVGVRWGTFIGGGPDQSGYVSQGSMWSRLELKQEIPQWAVEAPWTDAAWSATPVGYRVGPTGRDAVPTYPPGLPMIMGVVQASLGENSVFYVVPIFGSLTVLAAFLLGSHLGGPAAGAIAALLMLSNPIFLSMLVQPMSDVPATACWSLALALALRGTPRAAGGAGIAAAVATLIRPNLAPLAAVIVIVATVSADERSTTTFLSRLLRIGAPVALAASIIAGLNEFWYGSPMRSGYGELNYLYKSDRIWPNLKRYAAWLLQAQTPAFLVGPLAAAVRNPMGCNRWVATMVTTLFPLSVLALYLPYLVFDSWGYLRFLLPAFPALFAGFGVVMVVLIKRWPQSTLAFAGALATVMLLAHDGWRMAATLGVFSDAKPEQRYARAVGYCRTLPPNAIVLSVVHSGTLHHYCGRDVLRWEVLQPNQLDTAIAFFRDRGHPVYFIGDPSEATGFRQKFEHSESALRLMTQPTADLDGVVVYSIAQPRG